MVFSISDSIVFICLVKTSFRIFFPIFTTIKRMLGIISGYIVTYGKRVKTLTFDQKSSSKLILLSKFCKQCWVYTRFIYLRSFVI